MKIAAIRTHLLEHRLDVPFESASMRFDRRAHVLVEVECDDGTLGWETGRDKQKHKARETR